MAKYVNLTAVHIREMVMRRSTGVSAQKWVWQAMVRSALVPLVLVETVLIAVYLISNNLIREANMDYLYQKADNELQISALRESGIIREQVLAVSRQTAIYRAETQRVLTEAHYFVSEAEKSNHAVSPQGVFHSVKDTGGAASFYPASTPASKQDHEKVWRLSQLDPLMKQIKENNPLIASLYFNSWDSYNRIYPWFFTPDQYPVDMVIPNYNFYYLADGKNNPSRTEIWTDVYIDPAGHGWMASCIAPVYNGDFLEGVVGLDITVGTIIEKIQSLDIPWGGYAILVNGNGNIMAMPPEGEEDFGLNELTTHSYQEAIKQEIFKPEQFNLFLRKDSQQIISDIKNSHNGKGFLVLKGNKKLIAWDTIPETHWKLITIADENQVYTETNTLAKHFERIGYLMIAGLCLFYMIFIFFIWLRSRSMSQSVSQPLLHMKAMVDQIGKGEYQLEKPAFRIAELQDTATAIVNMGQKLNEITCALQQAKEEADSANKTKSLFLSSMSHELRTPLNAILGFGQLLQKDDNNLSFRERQNYINEMMTAGDHLLKLIDDVLNFSQIENTNTLLKIELLDAVSVIKECSEMLRPIAVKEQLILSADLPADPVLILADSTRLRQVLINLLSNAIKYNRPHGAINISVEISDNYLRVNVHDTGKGIAPEKQKELFTPFNRLGHETSGIKGTGIGLSISRQLMESMKGRIGFSSRMDKGSVFWIELPLADQPATVSESERVPESVDTVKTVQGDESERMAAATYNILCIGCESESVRQLTLLSGKGPVVISSVTSVADALRMLNQNDIHLILADIQRTDMNAYTLLRHLRGTERNRATPVIAITDEIMSLSLHATPGLRFTYALIKPFDVSHAWAVIEKMLNISPASE